MVQGFLGYLCCNLCDKALSEFWSHEIGTDWYLRHPVFQATCLQIKFLPVWYHILTFECFQISFSCGDLVAPEVNDPEWVIPLRLFGDGAESYSDLDHIPELTLVSTGILVARWVQKPIDPRKAKIWDFIPGLASGDWRCELHHGHMNLAAWLNLVYRLGMLGIWNIPTHNYIYLSKWKLYMCIYIKVCVYIYIYVFKFVNWYIYIFIDIYVIFEFYICIYIYIFVNINKYVYIYIQIINIYIYIYLILFVKYQYYILSNYVYIFHIFIYCIYGMFYIFIYVNKDHLYIHPSSEYIINICGKIFH